MGRGLTAALAFMAGLVLGLALGAFVSIDCEVALTCKEVGDGDTG